MTKPPLPMPPSREERPWTVRLANGRISQVFVLDLMQMVAKRQVTAGTLVAPQAKPDTFKPIEEWPMFWEIFGTTPPEQAVLDQTEEDAFDRKTLKDFPAEKVWQYADPKSRKPRPAVFAMLEIMIKTGELVNSSQICRPLSRQWTAIQDIPELEQACNDYLTSIAWPVALSDEERTFRNLAELRAWVSEGRIQRETRVFHPLNDQWVRAIDVVELADAWPARRMGCVGTILLAALALSVRFLTRLIGA